MPSARMHSWVRLRRRLRELTATGQGGPWRCICPKRGTKLAESVPPLVRYVWPGIPRISRKLERRILTENLLRTEGCRFRSYQGVGMHKDQKIIAYCGGGMSATTRLFAPQQSGYRNVKLYDGLLMEWTNGSRPPDGYRLKTVAARTGIPNALALVSVLLDRRCGLH